MDVADYIDNINSMNYLNLLDEDNYNLLCMKCKSYQEREIGLGRSLQKGELPNCERPWSNKIKRHK